MIPNYIVDIILNLRKSGYTAYIVGGCCRDILSGKVPHDWDIATNALPEEVQKIYPNSFYTNKFGTVTLKSIPFSTDKIEITTYRSDSDYIDLRHPKSVKFISSIEADLSRRDFTINAIALGIPEPKVTIDSAQKPKTIKLKDCQIIDLFDGQGDLKRKILRTVGKAKDRFSEDALRMIRAVRFCAQLDFDIEDQTYKAIKDNAHLIDKISKERIRTECFKVLTSDHAVKGVQLLKDLGLLKYIAPELLEGVGVTQNKHHVYTVFEHNLYSFKYACDKNYSLEVRLAALMHDIGKPRTKAGDGINATFYNHDIVGANMVKSLLERWKSDNTFISKVVLLVRYHMFYYNVGEVTQASIRRLLVKVGVDNIEDLIKLRQADRIGSGVPKAEPYKLRHFRYLVAKVLRDPLSVKVLNINGSEIMKKLKLPPGPRVGMLLNMLLAEVLDDPALNTKEYLTERLQALQSLPDEALKNALERIEFEKNKIDEIDKQKYHVGC